MVAINNLDEWPAERNTDTGLVIQLRNLIHKSTLGDIDYDTTDTDGLRDLDTKL